MAELVRMFCNEQDSIIVPRPCYANLFNDWWIKARVAIVLAYAKKKNKYEPTLADLQDAYETAICYGSQPKALFLSNICNPTGHLYSQSTLTQCLLWAFEKGLHVICDEIYCFSVFNKKCVAGAGFVSMAKIKYSLLKKEKKKSKASELQEYLTRYVHIIGGLSKDFGVSGLRVGVIYTENEDVLRASRGPYGALQGVSSHT